MASIIETIALGGIRKADGDVCAGGLVFLYRPGSANVRVTAYADRDKSAAAPLDSGGYRLDGAGRAALFIDEDAYVVVEDATGAQVATFTVSASVSAGVVEVISPSITGLLSTGQYGVGGRAYLDDVLTTLAGLAGGIDGMLKVTGTTTSLALATHIAQFGWTPQMFGAKGDNSTDDTAAFNALASAVTAGTVGKPVYIPHGTYRISAPVVFPTTSAPLVIRGAGRFASIIQQTVAATAGMTIGTNSTVDMADLAIAHSSSNGSTGLSIAGGGGPRPFLSRIDVSGFTTAAVSLATSATFVSCQITGIISGGAANALFDTTVTTVPTTTIAYTTAAQNQTFDMANGGSTTPVIGGSINVVRIRGTSAGAGTVNATAITPSSCLYGTVLVLECYNNSGGAFTFTLNAQYKSSANPAPANGSRTSVIFYANPTDNCWTACGRETST